jgi:hypothetical protein
MDSKNYQSIIGSLRYLNCTNPDIVFVMGGYKLINGGPEILIFESSKDDSQIC